MFATGPHAKVSTHTHTTYIIGLQILYIALKQNTHVHTHTVRVPEKVLCVCVFRQICVGRTAYNVTYFKDAKHGQDIVAVPVTTLFSLTEKPDLQKR
jgi:hypothetical protein